jgi:predicted transcriptional regulator
MEPDYGIFSMSKDAQAELDRRALAAIAAGKGVPLEKVVAWLKTWGTPQKGPPPAEWFE